MATDAPRVVSPLPASSSRPSSPAPPHRRRFSHIFSSFNLFSPKSRPSTPDRPPRKSASGGTTTAQPISNDEETASSMDAGVVDSSTSFGSPRSLVLTPLSSTPTSPSPPPSSPQSPKLGRSLSASKDGGIGSKIGAVLRVRSLRRRREEAAAAAAAAEKKNATDPRRHSHFREESDESGYIQDDEPANSANDDHLPRPPLQRKSSSGRMQVVRGWKDEEGRESVVKEANARRAKTSQGDARKDDGVELLLPVTETEHSSQNHGARRSNSQRSRSTVGSAFTEDLFYEALDSFEEEDKTPLGSEKTARPDEGIDNKNNGGDRISGTGHGNNKLSDINNYDDASLHPRVESALSSAPLSSDGDLDSSTTTSSNGDDKPRFDAGLSKVDPQGTITRASLAVSSDNSSSAVFDSQIDRTGVVQEASSGALNHSGRTAEQRRNNTRSTPEAIAQLSEYDIANIGIEVDPSTPETSANSSGVQPLTADPSPSPRGRTPSPPSHRRPPQRTSSTPPGSYTLDRDQGREIEKDNLKLAQPKTMISHPHSASASSSSAGQPSSFPPYPYAHLYPQQQRLQQQSPSPQPQASSSRHHHRTPHSHHGHGSGSGFAHNVPHQYQQPPQQKEAVSQSPWSGPLAAPASNTASSKAQKAWWSHFNFVRAMKKDGNAGDSGGYQAPDSAVPNGVVFGKPLKESLRHANVQISTADANGDLYVWGYIPVVVAKCGLYLKENATEVPGTFRVNGSTKRMRLLQEAFETPPRYGKNLDWKKENFTTHDVASVFRRYLTQMPEPVIPCELYHQFRDTLAKATNNQEEGVSKFKALIRQMPRANQYLLLYVLDLLSVFARKSDVNLMTATNLAVIFRPGLISHPDHEMSPHEHALSQKVLEFLIAQQDWFMLDIPPPPSRRNTAQNSPAIPAVQGHERRASADQRHGNPQPPQHLQQSSTTAVHHLSLDQQQHSQPQNVSPNVPPLSPFGPSSVAPSFAPQGTAPSAASPFQRGPSLSRFGSSSGRPLNEVGSEMDDVMIIPGGVLEEKEEFSAGPGGGWRLVSKTEQDAFKDRFVTEKDRLKMARRRTMERSDLQNREDALDDDKTHSRGPSSPAPTTPSHQSNGSGVKRSRTMPTSRRNDSDSKRLATSNQTAAGELVQASAGSTILKDKENYGSSSLGSGAKDPSRRGLLLKKGRRASHAVEKDRTL